MNRKVNVWWLALIAFTTFLSSGLFLISVLTTYATETYSLRYGGTTRAYNWSMQVIDGSYGFCNGIWSCADNICQLGSLPNDKFVAITPLAPHWENTSSCDINAQLSISWLWQWDTTKASFICLAIAMCIDIIAITMFLVTRSEPVSLSLKVIHYTLVTLGPLLMTVAHICAYVTMAQVIEESGDTPPIFVIIWQAVTSVALLLVVFCSHSLLRLPTGVRYMEY